MTPKYLIDSSRGFITVSGKDRFEFLQGLISNDVEKCRDGKAIWAAILTPQGKFLYDFYVFPRGEQLVLDCHKDELMPLGQLLRKYQLRSEIQLGIDSQTVSILLLGDWGFNGDNDVSDFCNGALMPDPRDARLGYRYAGSKDDFLKENNDKEVFDKKQYDQIRISLGIPDGPVDIEKNKGLLLEYGFDELHGVDWQKGCYMGQELTARTKYRALIKKRLMNISLVDQQTQEPIEYGAEIKAGDTLIGEIRSELDGNGLAFIRLDRMEKALEQGIAFTVSGREISITAPIWVQEKD